MKRLEVEDEVACLLASVLFLSISSLTQLAVFRARQRKATFEKSACHTKAHSLISPSAFATSYQSNAFTCLWSSNSSAISCLPSTPISFPEDRLQRLVECRLQGLQRDVGNHLDGANGNDCTLMYGLHSPTRAPHPTGEHGH